MDGFQSADDAPLKPKLTIVERIRYELFDKDPRRRQFLQMLIVVGMTIYEYANKVADLLVIDEFFERDHNTKFTASIVVFLIHTIFMIFIGLFIEKSEIRPRYSHNHKRNTAVSVAISLFQLRPLVETYLIYKAYSDPLHPTRFIKNNNFVQFDDESLLTTSFKKASNIPTNQDEADTMDSLSDFDRQTRTRNAVLLMSAMFLRAPQLIIQTFAIFDKGESTDLILSSSLSFGSIVGAISTYSCKQDTIFVQLLATTYVAGQLGMRMAAIIAVATINGAVENILFVSGIVISAVIFGTLLGLGRKSECMSERLIVSIIISPMLTLFAVDTSGQDLHTGSAYDSWTKGLLVPFTVWRFLENVAGVLIGAMGDNVDNFYSTTHLWVVTGAFAALYVIGYIVLKRKSTSATMAPV